MHVHPLDCYYTVFLHSGVQTDAYNHLIRHIVLSSGVVTTLAGQAGLSGSTNGIGTNAMFYYPNDIAMDAACTVLLVVSCFGVTLDAA